jgi:hypothetical protein
MRRLTEEQLQMKQVLHALALCLFQSNSLLYNEYTVEDFRLVRVGDKILKGTRIAFEKGDYTLGRKDERLPGAVPNLFLFSWRTKAHMVLKTTDPVEFLED